MKNCTEIAEAYHKFLADIDWGNKFYIKGIRYSRRNFLTDAFLGTYGDKKYNCGDYYSPTAWEIMESSNKSAGKLIFEHMVPKAKYILKPCEKKAESGDLTLDFIEEILRKYWKIAIITTEENKRLDSKSMPANWNKKDISARYTEAGVIIEPREHWIE